MTQSNIFSQGVANQVIARINKLNASTKPSWGKMDAAQMLAHVNVQYEFAYENIHKPIPSIARFFLKTFVKKGIVNEQPYKQNSSTAPQMLIKTPKDFTTEKQRLINYLQLVVNDGEQTYNGKEHLAFGTLTTAEWNNLFYKHINHHLTQFGV